MTLTTSIVKRCITINILAQWVTVCFTGEVMDNVEVTISTGEVKWSTAEVVLGVWAAVPYSNEVFHQVQVAIIGGVVQRNVSFFVLDSIIVTGNKKLAGKILPTPISSKMKQRNLSYRFFLYRSD